MNYPKEYLFPKPSANLQEGCDYIFCLEEYSCCEDVCKVKIVDIKCERNLPLVSLRNKCYGLF